MGAGGTSRAAGSLQHYFCLIDFPIPNSQFVPLTRAEARERGRGRLRRGAEGLVFVCVNSPRRRAEITDLKNGARGSGRGWRVYPCWALLSCSSRGLPLFRNDPEARSRLASDTNITSCAISADKGLLLECCKGELEQTRRTYVSTHTCPLFPSPPSPPTALLSRAHTLITDAAPALDH